MSWDQQALDAWMDESAKQDEDSMILYKYAKDDEGKIKVIVKYSLFFLVLLVLKIENIYANDEILH